LSLALVGSDPAVEKPVDVLVATFAPVTARPASGLSSPWQQSAVRERVAPCRIAPSTRAPFDACAVCNERLWSAGRREGDAGIRTLAPWFRGPPSNHSWWYRTPNDPRARSVNGRSSGFVPAFTRSVRDPSSAHRWRRDWGQGTRPVGFYRHGQGVGVGW